LVASIQSFVNNDSSSHIYGTSPGNQRIEAWWSFFRRLRSQWWIDLFETLVECGAFHPGNTRETECLRFCFMGPVQDDLNAVVTEWNTHRIRPSAGSSCPAGIPDELFFLPPPPFTDNLCAPNATLPLALLQQIEIPHACEDANFGRYLEYLCTFHQWDLPHDPYSAVQLYLRLHHFL
jgi:hypothetical protein